jgi:hypothetical protein
MPPQSEVLTVTDRRELDQMSRVIGGLENAIKNMSNQWQQQELAATEGRKSLQEKFEMFRHETVNQVTSMGIRLDRLVDTMREIEPAVRGFRDEKLRTEGSQRLGAKLWAALMVTAGISGWGLHELFGWLFHR